MKGSFVWREINTDAIMFAWKRRRAFSQHRLLKMWIIVLNLWAPPLFLSLQPDLLNHWNPPRGQRLTPLRLKTKKFLDPQHSTGREDSKLGLRRKVGGVFWLFFFFTLSYLIWATWPVFSPHLCRPSRSRRQRRRCWWIRRVCRRSSGIATRQTFPRGCRSCGTF